MLRFHLRYDFIYAYTFAYAYICIMKPIRAKPQ